MNKQLKNENKKCRNAVFPLEGNHQHNPLGLFARILLLSKVLNDLEKVMNNGRTETADSISYHRD